jgi:glucose 1-dehydrogenase
MVDEGRVAIVTGGGSGIGRATVLRLAADGASVVVADVDAEGADATREQAAAAGGSVTTASVDVSRRTEVDELVERTVERFGRLDVMVSNAGVAIERAFLETSEEEFDRVLDVNLKGAFLCGRAAARAMVEQRRGGWIVNVASTYAEVAAAGSSAYCVSKAGVRMLTKAMALELGPVGIRVNAVAPGWIRTGMNPLADPAEVRALEREIPIGRVGTPEDVASVIAFLVSGDAAYVGGETVLVDGGWIVR